MPGDGGVQFLSFAFHLSSAQREKCRYRSESNFLFLDATMNEITYRHTETGRLRDLLETTRRRRRRRKKREDDQRRTVKGLGRIEVHSTTVIRFPSVNVYVATTRDGLGSMALDDPRINN